MKILFATRNQGKLEEVRWLFSGTNWQIISPNEINFESDVSETGQTYRDNATLKARAAFARYRSWTVAEDSGLEIDALDGKPGVLSARFFPPGVNYFERCRRILEMLISVPDEQRTATFRCTVCLITPEGEEKIFDGVCRGRIAHAIRGGYGFGYDPIFIPEGSGLTFAEMGLETKNLLSHRAHAFRQLLKYLRDNS